MITDKDKYFIILAVNVSLASKCVRAKYGSVIVSKDGRIVSTGYNGKPRGSKNDDICYRLGLPDNAPKPNCCLHSEANALLFSDPLEREGGTIYVSGRPCTDCLLLIFQSGIKRLVYLDEDNYATGHSGNINHENLNETFIKDYGFNDKIDIVPITLDKVYEKLYEAIIK
jgi:dCMP deaminase